MQLEAVIYHDADAYTAICLNVNVASEGATPEEAQANLTEALELYFEDAGDVEIIPVAQPQLASLAISA